MKKVLFIIMLMVSVNTFGQTKETLILFTINKWDINEKENNINKLDNIISTFKFQQDTIYIKGDISKETGTVKRNMFLAEKRTEVIKDYLIKKGVDSNMIIVKEPFEDKYPESNFVEIIFKKDFVFKK